MCMIYMLFYVHACVCVYSHFVCEAYEMSFADARFAIKICIFMLTCQMLFYKLEYLFNKCLINTVFL